MNTTAQPKNLIASIQARLRNLARHSHRDVDAVLLHYFQERFLFQANPMGGFFTEVSHRGRCSIQHGRQYDPTIPGTIIWQYRWSHNIWTTALNV
jgi:hypothetical protein